MIRALVLIVATLSSAASSAQPMSRQQLLADALEGYGTVAGAWHLNQHCSLLDEGQASQFENDVAAITVAMRSELQTPTILLQIQQSSKAVTKTEPYANCGKEAEKVLQAASSHARNWARQIQALRAKSAIEPKE